MKINEGGTAYPARISVNRNTGELQPHQFGNDDFCTTGMSLRDAMAQSARMPENFSVDQASAILGEPRPSTYDPAALADWWLRAEAAYRYRLADAMLQYRKGEES